MEKNDLWQAALAKLEPSISRPNFLTWFQETGITGKIIEKLKPVTYFYTWQGEKRFKTVTYFLMEYVSGDTADHDWEMSQVEWLPEDKVKERLSFKSDKLAFEEALEKVAPVG